jgi:hypothetical protein
LKFSFTECEKIMLRSWESAEDQDDPRVRNAISAHRASIAEMERIIAEDDKRAAKKRRAGVTC